MRNVSQIYSEAVTARNNYLQLTELNTGRSNSKLSIINLLTYVVAVCIHTYEAILDRFQLNLVSVIQGRINGTPDWYALTARKFQYNNLTETGDTLIFNEDTMKIEYETVDVSRRIIEKAAWQMDDADNALVLKVCKVNDNSNEINNGIPYMPLSDQEMTAFRMFIRHIKFVGADIRCESNPGDILTIVANKKNPIFYNDSYVTAEQAMSEVQQALIDFANGLEYNGMLYYQAVLDVIRKTEHISDIGTNIEIYISSYNSEEGKYNDPAKLMGRTRLKSGYVRLLDENSMTTISTDNLTFVPVSKMEEYYASLNNQDD